VGLSCLLELGMQAGPSLCDSHSALLAVPLPVLLVLWPFMLPAPPPPLLELELLLWAARGALLSLAKPGVSAAALFDSEHVGRLPAQGACGAACCRTCCAVGTLLLLLPLLLVLVLVLVVGAASFVTPALRAAAAARPDSSSPNVAASIAALVMPVQHNSSAARHSTECMQIAMMTTIQAI
jgi:hypothetical protein